MAVGRDVTQRAAAAGDLLRGRRPERRIDRLEPELRPDASARHISFVETGRATPGLRLPSRLAEHHDVPFRDRNAVLTGAGQAPACTDTPLDDAASADAPWATAG